MFVSLYKKLVGGHDKLVKIWHMGWMISDVLDVWIYVSPRKFQICLGR